MPANRLDDLAWYLDPTANESGELGIRHSYMASLATALNYTTGELNPVWLMGTSAFAFRIFINEVMCPSAMSVFDWSTVLPEAIEQYGYGCVYMSRLWDEDDKEEERREAARTAIVEGIDRGAPAIVWDIGGHEWGLIVGYDENKHMYDTLTHRGESSSLPFEKLGRNGIDILSVAIPGERNGRSREEVVLRSLKAAIAHAEQKEWIDRPDYQDGLPAYDLWALLYNRWALILAHGKADKIPPDIPRHAAYYAAHYYSARCYARDYLSSIANGSEPLRRAAASYEAVASQLKPVWDHASKITKPESEALSRVAENIRSAKTAEQEGISHIREYVAQVSG